MEKRGLRKKLEGIVISNRMDKTVLVQVERLTKHQTYNKYIRRRAGYMAHDPRNMCRIGDRVTIIDCRPVSKRKRWQVVDINDKADIKA